MSRLRVDPAERGLSGRLRVPGDKSISHRALLLAALAPGRSLLSGLSSGQDVSHTAGAMEAFGAQLERLDPHTVEVVGGPSRLHQADSTIDVGNSGTGIRLLAGWVAPLEGVCVLDGDSSIARRPMGRVIHPLRSMGADIEGNNGGELAPLTITGSHLHGIDFTPPVASAQVKSAVLFAALSAEGPTTVREPLPTRQHTEEMFQIFGVDLEHSPGLVVVQPSVPSPADIAVPADPSQAAFWAVAASIVGGSDLVLENVYLGYGRSGFVQALEQMGAQLKVTPTGPDSGDLRIRSAGLEGCHIGGEIIPSLIDEIPVLAVAAAFAEGETVFSDAAELKVKETDRIATTVAALRAVGVEAQATEDGLVVKGNGGQRIEGGNVNSEGDHRIAMALAVAGLASHQGVVIDGWEAVSTSYPGFEEDLAQCG